MKSYTALTPTACTRSQGRKLPENAGTLRDFALHSTSSRNPGTPQPRNKRPGQAPHRARGVNEHTGQAPTPLHLPPNAFPLCGILTFRGREKGKWIWGRLCEYWGRSGQYSGAGKTKRQKNAHQRGAYLKATALCLADYPASEQIAILNASSKSSRDSSATWG